MRAVLLIVALAGCGRFGFGESSSTDAGGSLDDAMEDIDGAGPLATPQFCDDRVVTTLPIGQFDAVAIRAVALSASYAIAIETATLDVPLIEADASGNFVATHSPFTPNYAPLYGISKHNDRPVVHLKNAGMGYIKYVEPGWAAYGTGPSGDGAMIDPAYAELSATTGIAARILAGDFDVGLVDDSDPVVIDTSDYAPAGVISGSITRVPAGARVAIEKTGGVCETFIITPANTLRDLHTFSPCYAPKVAAVDDTSGVVLHRTDDVGPYAIHLIPANASDAGSTLPLSGATYARVTARTDGAVWVGHTSGSHRALMRIAPSGAMTESREATTGFYFDLTERDAFWYDGATVHVSTPCLR